MKPNLNWRREGITKRIMGVVIVMVMVAGLAIGVRAADKSEEVNPAKKEILEKRRKEALEKKQRLEAEQKEVIPRKPGDPLTPEREEWLRSRVEFIKNNMSKNDWSIGQALSELILVEREYGQIMSIAPNVVGVLVEVVKKHDLLLIRLKALTNLEIIGEKSAIPELTTALKNEEDMLVKGRIAEVLVGLGEIEAPFPVLADIVRRKDVEKWKVNLPVGVPRAPIAFIEVDIPCGALEALSKIGTEEAKSVIREALNDRNAKVREKAAHILRVGK